MMRGYYNVLNVSLQCLMIQETLMFFKLYELLNWRCIVVPEGTMFPVEVDLEESVVRLSPKLFEHDYVNASSILHSELYLVLQPSVRP
jgi:hypothetical protein